MSTGRACEILGGFIASEHYDRLSPAVVTRIKQCLQDSIGCLLAAHSTEVATTVQQYLRSAGVGDCTLLGSSMKIPVAAAAYANALLINALDYDDIYTKGHPGATTISAGLAAGERIDCSGMELIAALAVGYEVCGRAGLSLRHHEPRRLIHGHGTWQSFGAAAAVAKLLRLDRAQSAHALAVCGVNAPVASVMKTVYGTDGPTMAKNNFGSAAAAGVSSALLTREGYKGPLDLFEGETGFWRMAGADEFDAGALLEGLGQRYEILNVGFKPFSCCRILQAGIQAVLEAASHLGPRPPDDIERIVLEAAAIVSRPPFNDVHPRTMWAAQFSAPFACAMALLDVPPGPEWFSGGWYDHPDVLRLMQKIEIAPPPRGERVTARATVTSRAGRSSCAAAGVPRGEAANPLPQEYLDAKFLRLARHRLPPEKAQLLLSRIHALESETSIRSFVHALMFLID